MRVYYEQTRVYAPKKGNSPAVCAKPIMVVSLSFAYCIMMSYPISGVTPTTRTTFPLVRTSSNLKSLPVVAAKERVRAGTDLRRIERGRTQNMVKHSAANDEIIVPMEMMMFWRVYPMGGMRRNVKESTSDLEPQPRGVSALDLGSLVVTDESDIEKMAEERRKENRWGLYGKPRSSHA
jgi:hypothetical protein